MHWDDPRCLKTTERLGLASFYCEGSGYGDNVRVVVLISVLRGFIPGLSGTKIAPMRVGFHKGFVQSDGVCAMCLSSRVLGFKRAHQWRPVSRLRVLLSNAGGLVERPREKQNGRSPPSTMVSEIISNPSIIWFARLWVRAATISQKHPVGVELCLLGRDVNCFRV